MRLIGASTRLADRQFEPDKEKGAREFLPARLFWINSLTRRLHLRSGIRSGSSSVASGIRSSVGGFAGGVGCVSSSVGSFGRGISSGISSVGGSLGGRFGGFFSLLRASREGESGAGNSGSKNDLAHEW